MFFLHFSERKIQIWIRVRDTIRKINKLILYFELILKAESIVLKSILKLCAIDILNSSTRVKLNVLTILNPLFRRWIISVYLHAIIVKQLASRKIDNIEFSPPFIKVVAHLEEKPASVTLSITVHSQKKIILVITKRYS